MSATVKAALRPEIDQRTADYVDAACAVVDTECVVRTDNCCSRINLLEQEIAKLKVSVAEAKAIAADKPDDRYALTKVKLIRMMKEMGYYDDG